MGKMKKSMEFVNISFSKSSIFMGFHGVSSAIGSSVNQLGVVTFSCAPAKTKVEEDDKVDEDKNQNDSSNGSSIFD